MLELYTKLQARFNREEGQTMAEYAIVLAVISIAIISALSSVAGKV
jgi:Flp pilus assembly pilin Flp